MGREELCQWEGRPNLHQQILNPSRVEADISRMAACDQFQQVSQLPSGNKSNLKQDGFIVPFR